MANRDNASTATQTRRPAPQARLMSELLGEMQTLRGVLFGDRYHDPGALRELRDGIDSLRGEVSALRANLDAQGEALRLGQARWRWLLAGGSVVGAMVGSGLLGALERLLGQ